MPGPDGEVYIKVAQEQPMRRLLRVGDFVIWTKRPYGWRMKKTRREIVRVKKIPDVEPGKVEVMDAYCCWGAYEWDLETIDGATAEERHHWQAVDLLIPREGAES